MKRYFLVSDVHSFLKELMTALDNADFEKDNPEHILCVLGDLFDRGPDSIALFEFVKELNTQGRLIYIRGNHEDLLRDCVDEIRAGEIPGWHHFSNGTVKSICQFCGQNEWIIYDPTWTDKIYKTMRPVLDFINNNCVDYIEIGDYILTHGWLPTYSYLNDFRDASKSDWKEARWCNGMEMWTNPKNRVDGKTVICGHYHCSWGNARLHHIGSEFGEDAVFEPFVDDGIVAIDTCCAYTGKINVIVLEIDE